MTNLLRKLFEKLGANTAIPLRVHFADGSSYVSRSDPPQVTVTFKTATAQWNTIAFGHIGLLESYFAGAIDIEGPLAAAFEIASTSGFDDHRGHPLVNIRNRWHEFRFANDTIEQARINARFHYGLGGEFYRQWLDRDWMMYTCAYWKEGTRTIEEAQANKIEHVCRKIRLAPGESVVDIGCGFGGFMFYACQRRGVHGAAINTTNEQVDWVRDEVKRRHLSDRIDVRLADFREVHAQFDKVVSIGVLEHAGRDQLHEVVKAHADFLKPGGLGMLHFIGHVGVHETEFFIRRHVFPGGWIPSLAETITAMEDCGLEVVDIENLRRHYALTLDAWADRFDASWERIHALDPKKFNERFRRVWGTYLHGCANMFRSPRGRTHLFQITFSKGNISSSNYPMSRAFLHADTDSLARPAVPVREIPVPETV
jgi:cyclopropane-fatty-acyl-phospholipid synthase